MNDRDEKPTYPVMESYVVHVYQRCQKHPDNIIGIVETINTDQKDAFKGSSELTDIITRPPKKSATSPGSPEHKPSRNLG